MQNRSNLPTTEQGLLDSLTPINREAQLCINASNKLSNPNLFAPGVRSNKQSFTTQNFAQNPINSSRGVTGKGTKVDEIMAELENFANEQDYGDDQDNDNSRMGDNDSENDNNDMSDNSSSICLSKGSTTRKLSKIEKKIQRTDLTKRERRLLQNRKSALKCRLKKQDQLSQLQGKCDRLSGENRSLKEKISALNALLTCKNDENDQLNKKYNYLQFQQTLILASYLTKNGVQIENLPGDQGHQVAQDALAKLVRQSNTKIDSTDDVIAALKQNQTSNQTIETIQQQLQSVNPTKVHEAAGQRQIQAIINQQANAIQSNFGKKSIISGINKIQQTQVANLNGPFGSLGQFTSSSTQNNAGMSTSRPQSLENFESLQQQLFQLNAMKSGKGSQVNLSLSGEQVTTQESQFKLLQNINTNEATSSLKTKAQMLQHVNSVPQLNQEDDVDKIEDGPQINEPTDRQVDLVEQNQSNHDLQAQILLERLISEKKQKSDLNKMANMHHLLEKIRGVSDNQNQGQINQMGGGNTSDLSQFSIQQQQQMLQQLQMLSNQQNQLQQQQEQSDLSNSLQQQAISNQAQHQAINHNSLSNQLKNMSQNEQQAVLAAGAQQSMQSRQVASNISGALNCSEGNRTQLLQQLFLLKSQQQMQKLQGTAAKSPLNHQVNQIGHQTKKENFEQN